MLKTRPSSLSMLVVWVVSVLCAEKLWECPVLLLCVPHVHDMHFFKEERERENICLLMLNTLHMNVKIFIRSQSLHLGMWLPAVQKLLLLICRQYFITVLLTLLST